MLKNKITKTLAFTLATISIVSYGSNVFAYNNSVPNTKYKNKNMIKAVGENDIEGYISLDDLHDEENQPKSPEEAVAFMTKRAKSIKKYRLIPLYDTDGITKIGEYRIDL